MKINVSEKEVRDFLGVPETVSELSGIDVRQ